MEETSAAPRGQAGEEEEGQDADGPECMAAVRATEVSSFETNSG